MITELTIATYGNKKDIQAIFASNGESEWKLAENSPVTKETFGTDKDEYVVKDAAGLTSLISEGYLVEVQNQTRFVGKIVKLTAKGWDFINATYAEKAG